jgi:hypothetical protein
MKHTTNRWFGVRARVEAGKTFGEELPLALLNVVPGNQTLFNISWSAQYDGLRICN